MNKLRIVSNSSPLIALAQVHKFWLLKEIFSQIYIPEAVYREVVVAGEGDPGCKETKDGIKDGWIRKENVKNSVAVIAFMSILSQGEAETIILAKETDADYILIDEATGREEAELMEVEVIGTLGILNLALNKKLIDKKKSIVDELKEKGFRISKSLYHKVIEEDG